MALGSFAILGCAENQPPNSIPAMEAAALESGEKLTLFSLEPQEHLPDGNGQFHGWKVLGEISLKNEERKRIIAAFEAGVAESKGVVASCFQPRHGIRVTHEGKEYDFVICFECLWSERYVDGQTNGILTLSRTPQRIFDDVLRRASVPLAKPSPTHER